MEGFLFSILIWVSSFNPNVAKQANVNDFVLSETEQAYVLAISNAESNCAECHSDLMELKRKHKPASEGCDKCHSPNGKEHPKKEVQGFAFAQEMPKLCFSCHDSLTYKKNVHKPIVDGKCVDCHSPHSSKYKKLLTTKKSADLCKECHDLKIPETNVIHNPVKGGRCHKCHDPHQSDFDSFLKNEMPSLCYRCHEGVEEEMKLRRKHTAAKESCTNCHDPHSNKQSYLLPDTVPNLCFKCHDNLLVGENPHQEKLNTDCKKCHAIHASKNKMLLKEKKAVAICNECHTLEIPETNVVHNPVSSGRCNKCHDPHQNEFGSFLKQKTPDLCYKCHDGVAEEMKLKRKHTAAKESCTNCHDPHSNKQSYLLSDTIPNLCFKCHDNLLAGENPHQEKLNKDCKKCHAVHASKNKMLLKEKKAVAICNECHTLEIPETDVVHNPVNSGRCNKCHDPHQSDFGSFLKNDMPDLCFRCHDGVDAEMKSENVHTPAKESCFKCHDAHSAKESYLLPEFVPALCYRCHQDFQKEIENTPIVHQALNDEKSCSNCHTSHGSSVGKLLKSNEKELCLSCHNKTYKTEAGTISNIKQQLEKSKFIHGPVNHGCSMCHDPHASKNPYLMVNNFPTGSYAPANKDNFALCFECHDSELLSQAKTTTATNFRNGDQNMHFLHINGNRGRNCTTCHNLHGSKNEHLIRNKASYGNWEMPIKFKKQNNGGSCFPGCHSEEKYSRN